MDMPFQMQSMVPEASSSSLASQEMGCAMNSTPSRAATSLATSMSKPTMSLFSSRNPIGGKLSSRPRMKVPFSRMFSTEVSSSAMARPETASIRTSRMANSFFILQTRSFSQPL